jgi:hypothetical protein
MMKKTCILLLLLIPFLLLAQETQEESKAKAEFGFNGNAGYLTTGTITYSQIRLLPEFEFGKFGIGLDIDLLLTSDLSIRKADWDETEDILGKLLYLRYGERYDPFYLKAGAFSGYTLGYGLIMNAYDNRLLYPEQKNIGAAAGFNLNFPFQPGIEVFTSNLLKNEILAAQAFLKPFPQSLSPTLSGLVIGAAAAIDRNQYGRFEDKDKDLIPDVLDPNPRLRNYRYDLDGDGLTNSELPDANGQYQTNDPDLDGDGILDSPDLNSYVSDNLELLDPDLNSLLDNEIKPLKRYGEENDLSIVGVNFSLPLIETSSFLLDAYGEAAKINGYGSGYSFPGFASSFLMFDLNLELRQFSDRFVAGYFDYLYDEQRSSVVGDTLIMTKDKTLDDTKAALGWFGSLQAEIGKLVIAKASFQDMYNDTSSKGKSLGVSLSLIQGGIGRFKDAALNYNLTNVPSISFSKLQSPTANLSCMLSYGLSDRAVLTGKYKERYIDLNGDGKIQGKDEIIKSMSLLVEFRL